MNGFTKEELEELKYCISDMQEFFDDSYGVIFKLHEKVKYMIDNYCEHESDGLFYLSNPPQNKCKKCNEWYR